MKLLAAICLSLVIISCKSQLGLLPAEKEIVFENILGDSIVVFYGNKRDTLNIFRKIEVIENNNTDTVLLGYGIMPPGFKGNIFFAQDGLDKSKAVYPDPAIELNPEKESSYGKLFTIGVWKKPSGVLKRIKLKVRLKEDF